MQLRYGPNSINVEILSIKPSIHPDKKFVVNGKVNGLEIQVYCDDDTKKGAKDALAKYYYSR
jgi:hypothetical protein